MSIDPANSCRICMISNCSLTSIFQTHNKTPISEIINIISGIVIKNDDSLSKKICEECKLESIKLLALRKICIDSDSIMRRNAQNDCVQPIAPKQKISPKKLRGSVKALKTKRGRFCEQSFVNNHRREYEFVCDSRFTFNMLSHKTVFRHMRFMHKPITKKQFMGNHSRTENKQLFCVICKKTFKREKSLKSHELFCDVIQNSIIQWQDDHQFFCVICSHAFDTHAKMIGHIKKHERMYTYSCVKCPDVSLSYSSIIQHGKCHEENAVYRCSICQMLFANKNTFAAHFAATHKRN